ncbi:hypothetical protein [Nonomuraea pusilla]|uniref:Beta/Gamma crystallin n=1 Tax=Nonomuraea pusilla TaxID=46177 RepID=A0A1H7ULA6_9ACTN|nr:hypothetical protein [Nonomuraea pusilla]SEL97579.1 hypothetical protein SAMN05660976_03857 [Nonomuraea pusilla]
MKRRLAAGLAAAALGATMVATAASPALADPEPDPDFVGGNTSLQFDAGPEPAWRGRGLTLEGKLSVECDEDYINGFVEVHHADYCKDSERWHRLGWKRIVILFQADGSRGWDYVESVRTSRNGYFRTKVPAYTSGTWRAVFEGSRYLAPSEGKDWVKVVGRH